MADNLDDIKRELGVTNDNEIYLMSPIYDETALRFCQAMDTIPKEEDIKVLNNSPGGSVFAGWTMIGRMRERTGAVDCNVYGHAASMSMFFLLYCRKVEALEVSRFLIHKAYGRVETEEDQKFLDSVNKDLRVAMEKKFDAIAFKEILGITIKELFEQEGNKDYWINAKEAKKIGLIQKINRMNPEEMKAHNEKFVLLASSLRVSNEDTRGSGNKQIENKNNINQISKKMNREELKANHPELFNAIYAEGKEEGIKAGIKQEQVRVKSFLAFNEHCSEDVIKALKEGTEFTGDVQAELTVKTVSAVKLQAANNDGKKLDAGSQGEVDNKTEDEKKIEAANKEVAQALSNFKLS